MDPLLAFAKNPGALELIKAIVEVMQPKPDDRVCDPACVTGGFFIGGL
jgi:tRNA G10  N-methylase Trm11